MKKQFLFILAFMTLVGLRAQTVGDESTITDIDGNVYSTKFMPDGNWWMLENLKVTKKPDGSDAQYVFPPNADKVPDQSLVAQAGLLYDRDMLLGWPHALRAQGLCPDGWHVPTRVEFEKLNTALGGINCFWSECPPAYTPMVDALLIKDTRGGKWDPTGNYTDAALTGWGSYYYVSTNAWGNKEIAFMVALEASGVGGGVTQDPKNVAGNCRCVKDREITGTITSFDEDGLTVTLSSKIINNVNQVVVYDITDDYQLDLTAVALSTDSLTIYITAYLDAEYNHYEVKFMDTQSPSLPIAGYVFNGGNGIRTDLTSSRQVKEILGKVYPNPATNVMFAEMKNLSSVTLYNSIGARTRQFPASSDVQEIRLSGLPSGIYSVVLMDKSGNSITRKLIVTRE